MPNGSPSDYLGEGPLSLVSLERREAERLKRLDVEPATLYRYLCKHCGNTFFTPAPLGRESMCPRLSDCDEVGPPEYKGPTLVRFDPHA